ncbi:MAG: ABC transporter ATP-binding protein [Acidimicrobiales bacterium]
MSLELQAINAGYGSQQILFDVSVTFERGKLTAIIGPNGAGKSTLIKSLFGQAHLFEGGVLLDGEEIKPIRARELIRRGVAYVPQLANVFSALTVRENLELGAYVRSGKGLDMVLELFPDLAAIMRRPAGKLSGGQRNMVAIGRALMCDPTVLLLDEATAGLSVTRARAVWQYLLRIVESGIAVGVVEQNVTAALDNSDYVYVLASGRVRQEGTSAALAKDDGLEDIMLGAEAVYAGSSE